MVRYALYFNREILTPTFFTYIISPEEYSSYMINFFYTVWLIFTIIIQTNLNLTESKQVVQCVEQTYAK